MYTFTDRGGRSRTLRPEATAPIARAYVQRGLFQESQPQKLYTVGTMYRYAAPQHGRYREHWQVSVEVLGSDDPVIDAEVIRLYYSWLQRLSPRPYALKVNTSDNRNCRPHYVEASIGWLYAN